MDTFETEGGGLPDFLRDPVGIAQRRWRTAILVLLLLAPLATAGVYLHKSFYLAEAKVLISGQRIAETLIASTVQQAPIDRANAILKDVISVPHLLQLIEKHGLYPELRGPGQRDQLVTALRSRVHIGTSRGVEAHGRHHQLGLVVAVGFQADRADLAAAVANDLAARFTDSGLLVQSRHARLTTEFLEGELRDAETALQEHLQKVATFQSRHRGELPSELESKLRRLDRLQEHRSALRLQLAEAERWLASARSGQLTEDSPAARVAGLRAALARELALRTEEHPNVVALREEIELYTAEVSKGNAQDSQVLQDRAIGDQQFVVNQLRKQIAEVSQGIAETELRVANIPAREQELTTMEEKSRVLRNKYEEYLHKVEQAQVAEDLYRAQQGVEVAILEPALPPPQKRNRRPLLAAGAAALCFGMALAAALAKEWFDPHLATAEGVEAELGIPVLGSIPSIV